MWLIQLILRQFTEFYILIASKLVSETVNLRRIYPINRINRLWHSVAVD